MSQVFCLVINELGAFLQVTAGLNDFISLTHASHRGITTGDWGGTHGKLTLIGMVGWQTLKVMEPPCSLSPPLLPHSPNSPHPPSQYRCVPPRALTGRRGVNAFMDMLRVPNDKHKLIWMLIYSLSAHSLLNPHRLCKTINSKGTLRSGLYTLFILGNDKSL